MMNISPHSEQKKEQEQFQQYLDDQHFLQRQLTEFNPDHDSNAVKALCSPHLKIAIVTETWSPEINGVAHSLLNLCQGLQRQGHQIQLIRPRPVSPCTRFQPEQECWVRGQGIPQYSGLQFGWPQLGKISQAMHRFNPDVVHIVTEGPLGLVALWVAKRQGRVISSGYHSSFHEFSRYFKFPFLINPVKRYLRWFHNQTALTCVPSQDSVQMMKAERFLCQLQVVGRGVNTQLFHPRKRRESLRQQWGATAETTVWLSVGRLSPEKEIDLMIEGCRHYKTRQSRPIRLVIVGDGPDRQRLQQLAHGLDIVFMGSLVGEALAAAYASADVFIFPSQVETFGNVVLEAMASGLPVLAYDYACAKQYIEPGLQGWLLPLPERQAFIRAMQQFPDLAVLRSMGNQAASKVKYASWFIPVLDMEQALLQVYQQHQANMTSALSNPHQNVTTFA